MYLFLYACRYFNSLQSECFATCYLSDLNMVISAPTGSGKTVLFELCIMRLLSKFITDDGKFTHHIGTLKTVGFLMVLVAQGLWLLLTGVSILCFEDLYSTIKGLGTREAQALDTEAWNIGNKLP